MTEITWYKRFHGTAFDPKFKAVALEAGSTRCNALAVWDAVLEMSSESDQRGTILGLDARVIAAGLDLVVDEVRRIWEGFVALGMIAGERIVAWTKRQGASVDKLKAAVSAGAARTRQWRKRKEGAAREPELPFDCPENPMSKGVTRAVTTANSASRRPSPRRTEEEKDKDSSSEPFGSDARETAPCSQTKGDFAEFWREYPHKVGKIDAEKAFRVVRRKVSLATLLEGLRRYVAAKPPEREWCNPGTWLRKGRWLDEPAPKLAIVGGTALNDGFQGPRQGPPKVTEATLRRARGEI